MRPDHGFDLELTRVFDAPADRVYQAFTDPDRFARWYGPPGMSVPRDTVHIDARRGGRQRFVLVADADPGLRSAMTIQFTEVVENRLLAATQDAEIPGQPGTWTSGLRLEFHDQDGQTRLVLREGPHPEGMVELGRQAWEHMFPKLDRVLQG